NITLSGFIIGGWLDAVPPRPQPHDGGASGHLPLAADSGRMRGATGSRAGRRSRDARRRLHQGSRLYVRAVICSDTSPIRKTITAALNSSALMLVNRPWVVNVYA